MKKIAYREATFVEWEMLDFAETFLVRIMQEAAALILCATGSLDMAADVRASAGSRVLHGRVRGGRGRYGRSARQAGLPRRAIGLSAATTGEFAMPGRHHPGQSEGPPEGA
jgi:hypothetical protein